MPSYNLFMGGDYGNTDNRMIPQQNPCDIVSYSDHQRARSYSVVRQIDFRARVPYGGLDGPVDQKDYDWYQQLLDSGVDIEVGDFLNLIFIPAYTRLEWVEAKVILPRTSLVTTLIRRQNACGGSPALDTIAIAAASNSPLAVNAIGATAGYFFSQRIDSTLLEGSYISLEVTAVPPTGNALDGFFAAVQAEVNDWGSTDLNGNA